MSDDNKKVEEKKAEESKVQEAPAGVTEYKSTDEYLEEERERVEKIKEDAKKGVKTDSDGRVIGVDAENPVSNVNPDPRQVKYVR